jgi:chorismate mutase/prephenate dehydratase
MQEIEKLRSEIDQIQSEMASLFRRRLQVTRKIWEIKISQGLPFFDAEREKGIIHRFDAQISDPDEQLALQNLMKSILSENKKYLETQLTRKN